MGILNALRSRRARHLSSSLPPWKPGEAMVGHVVQFYGGRFPAQDVANFLREGIQAEEVCLVIAKPGHIATIDGFLDRPGKCIYLDAEGALDTFMVHGRPDRTKFFDNVGDLVAQAAEAGGGRVRAFGEMVAILCERGEPKAAHELEMLGNELARRYQIRLLCTYPMDALSGRSRPMAAPLRDTHSHAVA